MARREQEETAASASSGEEGKGTPRTPQERAERIVGWTIAELHKLAGVKGLTPAEITEMNRHLQEQLDATVAQLRAVNSQPFKFGSSSTCAAGEASAES